jgi:hypothetical protein
MGVYSAACVRGVGGLGTVTRAADPHAQQREQQIDVHRLGDIVRGAGIEALLTIALHRLAVTEISGTWPIASLARIARIVS